MAIKKRNQLQDAGDFYNPFDAMSFTYDQCFLCGHQLENDKTNEHDFPKWIQQRYHLQNQKIILLNKTEIPYRQLTIPCCPSCNNQYLSRVENTFKQYFERGLSEFKKLDKLIIFQWITKIFYGKTAVKFENPTKFSGMISKMKRICTDHGIILTATCRSSGNKRPIPLPEGGSYLRHTANVIIYFRENKKGGISAFLLKHLDKSPGGKIVRNMGENPWGG